MNGIVTARLLGRFGNQLSSYAYARGYAEQVGAEFQCDSWVGSMVFQIDDKPVSAELPVRCETQIVPGETNICVHSYGQQQCCMVYTREQIRSWFRLRPEWERILRAGIKPSKIAAHRRVGDYIGYGFPVVSEQSYRNACGKFGLDVEQMDWVTEETEQTLAGIPSGIAYLPDFYKLMTAKVLLRGNSTFSWWAAAIGDHDAVYAPIVEGLAGGMEHDCQFVLGNYPRLANLEFVTDLHLKGEA